jgi:1,3-beta-galactosyl-N-acetylhexosamine phosphorylase
LSGLPVEVQFISLQDIEENGVPSDINVLINDGEDGTAWSGGHHWANEKIVSAIRQWVHNGGGFVGNIGPTAYHHQGRYFQLADVMGVEKEIGQSVMTAAAKFELADNHFITDDNFTSFDFGIDNSYIFANSRSTQVLKTNNDGLHIHMAANNFGAGRGVYMAGLPYSLENSRLLHRALFWAAGKENELNKWFSSNLNTDCAAYSETGNFAVVNNSDVRQETIVYDGQGKEFKISLKSHELKWFSMAKSSIIALSGFSKDKKTYSNTTKRQND